MSAESSLFEPLTWKLGRRTFLRAGALAFGGWTIADQLRLRAESPVPMPADTAVIQVFCGGGPSHIDMYDLKPNAPKEIRGEFNPISSSVAGYSFSEHLPRQAAAMDKLAIVRTVQHSNPGHLPASHWMMTGYEAPASAKMNFNPSIGSVVSHLRGPNVEGLPGYVSIPGKQLLGGSAYLGSAHNPFILGSNPASPDFTVMNLALAPGMTSDRMTNRTRLRNQLDQMQGNNNQQDFPGDLDRFSQQAYKMVTGEKASKAFNLSQESPKLREMYGNHSAGQGCLLARRLVEAGVTFVTVLSGGEWDTHTDNFRTLKNDCLPRVDDAVSALVTDLYDRGLDKRVMVIVNGEFGRTPQINKDAGRDHWPGASCVLFSGGGINVGQMIGETDSRAAYPTTHPYTPGDVLSTVYSFLGVDYHRRFDDQTQRTFPVLPEGKPISALYA